MFKNLRTLIKSCILRKSLNFLAPVARNGDLSPSLSPSPNQMTIPQSFRDSLSRNSFHMESSARSEPNSRRTSIISVSYKTSTSEVLQ